jgi:hypothetical protein
MMSERGGPASRGFLPFIAASPNFKDNFTFWA